MYTITKIKVYKINKIKMYTITKIKKYLPAVHSMVGK